MKRISLFAEENRFEKCEGSKVEDKKTEYQTGNYLRGCIICMYDGK